MKKLALVSGIIFLLTTLSAHAENSVVTGKGAGKNDLWEGTTGISCWDDSEEGLKPIVEELLQSTKLAADKDALGKCEQLGLSKAVRIQEYNTNISCFNFGFLLSIGVNAQYECL